MMKASHSDIMSAIYSKNYMAYHTLGGKSSKVSTKDGLPKADTEKLIGKLCLAFSCGSLIQYAMSCQSAFFCKCFLKYRISHKYSELLILQKIVG